MCNKYRNHIVSIHAIGPISTENSKQWAFFATLTLKLWQEGQFQFTDEKARRVLGFLKVEIQVQIKTKYVAIVWQNITNFNYVYFRNQ